MRRILTASLAVLLGTAALAATAPTASAAVVTPPPTLRVMPLGDSITNGYSSSTGDGYRKPLAELIAGQNGYRVDYVGSQQGGGLADRDHEGHSGFMIDDIRNGVDGWLTAAQPDVVLLHIGVNDLDRGTDKAGAPARLAALVDRILADRPGVTVVVQGVIPTTPRVASLTGPYNSAVRQAVADRQAGGKKVRYAEPPALTSGELPDGLHPNDAGFRRMADAYFGGLQQAVRDGWATRPDARRAGTESGEADRVRWADWDGDGKTDRVVINDNGSVVVTPSNGGDGHGGWKPSYQVASGLTSDRSRVRLADWDGDGRADYLVINGNGSVQVYVSNGGDGHGGWKDSYQVASGVTNDPTKVRFADWDGDGRADYLAFEDSGAFQVYLNRGGDGRGGWGPQGQVATGMTPDRSRVRLADLDGDGRADYAVINGNGSVQAFLNRGGDGHGGWEGLGQIASGLTTDQTKVHFADVNADVHADYLTTDPDGSTTAYTWNGGDGQGGWNPYGRITSGS
ncbi:FG-GAP-like repeat-containing protein [Kitasatospora sp. NPDC096147]|uniref:FG-GAP-like repeat-containing protein n=1 Tax=Kitasatospora sp. NPDC096147 TaxID=3364093 RepID=UPI0037FE0F4D